MERYRVKFAEEARELLGQLEENLLKLEEAPGDINYVNEIFRIMHSLKGSGAMFGFTKISSLTHDLEDIYASIRSGSLMVSKHLIDLSFQSIDLVDHLLDSKETPEKLAQLEEIRTALSSILDHKKGDIQQAPDIEASQPVQPLSKSEKPSSCFFISFCPAPELLINGISPLYLLDELNSYGELIAAPFFIEPPVLGDKDPKLCVTAWNMLLEGNVSYDTIREVFIFAEYQSEIEISESKVTLSSLSEQMKIDIKEYMSQGPLINEDLFNWANKSKERADEKSRATTVPKSDAISIRVSSQRIDDLMNLVSELIISQGQLIVQAETLKNDPLISLSEKFEKLIRQLREQTMEMSLVSLNTLTTRFKRLVRDLSGKLGKKAELVIDGGETELDKTIIEHLSEPLLHILRNSLDHGIESPEERIALGKPESGKILIRAFYSGAEVHISIEDDGQGIAPETVKANALRKGLISHGQVLSKSEMFKLLFLPGFSTSEHSNEYSGRGVGMDVVEKKIGSLRGEVQINSEVGKGTTVLIKLPLTLTILDGLLTRVGETGYIIPVSSIRKIYEVGAVGLEQAFNNLIVLDGEQVPFLILSKEFNNTLPDTSNLQLIMVEYESRKMGLVVDEILGERQAVLKPLGQSFKKNRMFSGGSIMGDGQIAFILDTNKLIRKFTKE